MQHSLHEVATTGNWVMHLGLDVSIIHSIVAYTKNIYV